MPKTHVLPPQHWKKQALIGFVLLIVGAFLIWDCFDNSGRKLPWPLSGLAFW